MTGFSSSQEPFKKAANVKMRPAPVSVRFSAEELAVLKEAASGHPLSTYIKARVLGKRPITKAACDTGYSGRDESVMALFSSALDGANPFPHGLFWTGMKGSRQLPAVQSLLDQATEKGIVAHYVPVETFASQLSRIWRNIEDKTAKLDLQVRKSNAATVSIPMPPVGTANPLVASMFF